VALALVLLVGTGLLVRSLIRLMNEDPGFRTSGILTIQGNCAGDFERGFSPKISQMFDEMVRQVNWLPGVQASGAISFLPMSGSNSNADIQVEGYIAPSSGAMPRLTTTRPLRVTFPPWAFHS